MHIFWRLLFWQAAGDCVEKFERLVAECHKSSEPLKSVVSPAAFVKVTKQLGDLDSALDDVRLNLVNTRADQELETYHVDNYDNLLQVGITADDIISKLALRISSAKN